MTDIEKKALALVEEAANSRDDTRIPPPLVGTVFIYEAFLRAIEQHEAFRQEVSDAVESAINSSYLPAPTMHKLRRFVIAKPDPLVEAVGEAMEAHEVYSKFELTDSLREALARRGMKIVMENEQ